MKASRKMLAAAAILSSTLVAAQPATPPVYLDAVANDDERRLLNRLIREAHTVLRSPAFRTNMAAMGGLHPKIFVGTALPEVDAARVLKILAGQEPGTRWIRVPVALIGDESFGAPGDLFNYQARTGPVGRNGDEPDGSMSLGRINLRRYRNQTDVVERSCAVNTMAHEITHTMSSHPTRYRYVFSDTGTGAGTDPNVPVASYLVGSVAQCTYLQQQRRITAAQVPACVAVFGTRSFNNLRCDDFAGTGRVRD